MVLQALPDKNGFLTVLLLPGPLAFEGVLHRTVHPLLVYTVLITSVELDTQERAALGIA
jgi:hypothetical protein